MKFRKIIQVRGRKIQTILKLVIFEFPDKLIWIILRNVLKSNVSKPLPHGLPEFMREN